MRNRRMLSLLVLPLLAGVAGATVVLRVGVEELADRATIIVEGEVLSSRAGWTPDHATIRTVVRVRVGKVWKGSAGEEVAVTCFGGRVGDEEVRVRGVPKFEKGERVVLFLWRNRKGDLLPLGLNQGKFRVTRDPETGREVARNDLSGLSFARLPGRRIRPGTSAKPDVLPLAELERRVRDRLSRSAERGEEKEPGPPEKRKEAAGRPTPGEKSPPAPAGDDPGERVEPPAGTEPPSPATKPPPGKEEGPPAREETAPGEKKKPGEGDPPGRR